MSRNTFNKAPNFYEYEDDEEEGILSKTGTFMSSLFYKVINTINPFKSKKYVENPYDLNSENDPINHLNYIDKINPNQNYQTNQVYLGNNNYVEYSDINNNTQNQFNFENNNEYLTVQELCNISPKLKDEIYKDIKRPNYIPNEDLFQKAKKYVYENLIKKYKIIRPKINDKVFGEKVILLAIQLTNKYNIEKHYDYLVNNRANIEYRLNINVPEIIQNYYNNKAKTIYHEDIMDNYDSINNDINKELFNKFSHIANNSKEDNNLLSNNSETRLICRTPRTKRNYITFLYENNYNYDSLSQNEKKNFQIYKECLIHRENDLKNYARVVEVTNNIFKYICNENEKLKEVIKQKEKRLEEFTKQMILNKTKEAEKDQMISNLKKEINDLKNNNIININSNINQANSLLNNNNNISDNININNNNNIFTLKKPPELGSQFSFNNQNNSKSSERTATFNTNILKNNSSLFSKSNKNINSNAFLVLNSQSNDKNDSQIKKSENESAQKKVSKLFSFIESNDKKEENENKLNDKKKRRKN